MSPLSQRGHVVSSVCLSLCVCVSHWFMFSAFYLAGGRLVDPMLGWCWPTVYDAEPTLAQYLDYCVVFNATLNVGQRHRWQANINPALVQSIVPPAWSTNYGWMEIPAPATLAQHSTVIESVPASRPTRLQQYAARPAAQQKRGVKPVLIWCWASVADSGPELDQHWVNVSCLLGVLTGHIMFCTSPGVKILKLLPNWLSLKTIFYCRYKKNGFHHIKIHSLYCPQEPFINIYYKSHWYYIY